MVSAGRVFALIDERTYEPEQRDTDAKVTEGTLALKMSLSPMMVNTRF